MVGIRRQVSAGAGLSAKLDKNPPMIRPGLEDLHFLPRAKIFDKRKGGGKGCGGSVNFGMGDNPQTAAQNKLGHGEARSIPQGRFQPIGNFTMLVRVHPVQVYEDIHIQKNHLPSIASSRSADESISTPESKPSPLNVLNGRGGAAHAPLGRDTN